MDFAPGTDKSPCHQWALPIHLIGPCLMTSADSSPLREAQAFRCGRAANPIVYLFVTCISHFHWIKAVYHICMPNSPRWQTWKLS